MELVPDVEVLFEFIGQRKGKQSFPQNGTV